jgi:hypothetical protein
VVVSYNVAWPTPDTGVENTTTSVDVMFTASGITGLVITSKDEERAVTCMPKPLVTCAEGVSDTTSLADSADAAVNTTPEFCEATARGGESRGAHDKRPCT